MSAPTLDRDPSSREAEAFAELAATRISRGARRALAFGLLATIAIGPIVELVALARGDSLLYRRLTPSGTTLLEKVRSAIDEIDRRFDEQSALVRSVRPRLQRLLTSTVGQGNERAIVGRDGWLFFADDVSHLVGRRNGSDFAGDPERTIVAFRDALAARGIALLVVPVPVKPSIQPERLGALRKPAISPPARRAGEAALLSRLAERGVELLDLAPRFARDAALAPRYLATDTHWRPETMESAAEEIALRLRSIAELPPADAVAIEPELAVPRTVDGSGDLVALLGLEPDALPRERVEVLPGALRSDAEGAPVLLLGDSFAAIYSASELGWGGGAGLPERLAARLGLPVDRIVQNAGGASATRERLARELAADPARLDGVRVVVWLFAAREWSRGAWRDVALGP